MRKLPVGSFARVKSGKKRGQMVRIVEHLAEVRPPSVLVQVKPLVARRHRNHTTLEAFRLEPLNDMEILAEATR